MRVVVAGAGFAGLLAADRVARAGHEVVVLEARAVVGELGLRLADTGMSYYEREPRGGAPTTHQETARCAERVAAAAVADVTAGFERRPSWREAGGNQRLAAGLAGRLPAPVRLRRPVRAVEHDQAGVRVLTDDGEVRGDAVIVAVPMAVLRAMRFSPPVPPAYDPWAGASYSALTVTVADGVLIHAVP